MNKSYALTNEDEQLLLEILLSQNFAFEPCELFDIENGIKKVNVQRLKQLKKIILQLILDNSS